MQTIHKTSPILKSLQSSTQTVYANLQNKVSNQRLANLIFSRFLIFLSSISLSGIADGAVAHGMINENNN